MTDDVPTEDSGKSKPSRLSLTKRLLLLARPELKSILWGTCFLLIGTAMSLSYPQAVRLIVDEALGARDQAMIDKAALALLLIFAIQGVSLALRAYLFTTAGERIVARLRENLYERIIHQEVGFFDTVRTGELTSRLAADTSVIQNTVSVNISMGLRFLASAVGGMALLFYTSPTLTTIMLLVVPPVSLGAVYIGRRIRKLAKEGQDALARAGEVAEETIAGLRTVRAFGHEDRETARYTRAVMETFEIAKRRARAAALFIGTASFAGYTAVAIVLWYGGRLVITDAMSIGELTSFVLYTLFVAFSLGALGGLWTDLMRATGAAERVFALMDREPAILHGQGVTIDRPAGRIDFDNVTFAYPGRPDINVLRDIQLRIDPGQVVALVGPSGSGKSTVAALLTRFYDPSEGQIRLDAHDISILDPVWLRQQMGVVAQEPVLFSTTVADNIRYGRLEATQSEIEAAAKMANAHEFILDFPESYETHVGERGVQLSGGQKQRVAIARAILKDPAVLILDEATSSLDTKSERLVQEALDRLMESRTTLIIAHRLSTVKNADCVIVINDGVVVEMGNHATLIKADGLYQSLIEHQLTL